MQTSTPASGDYFKNEYIEISLDQLGKVLQAYAEDADVMTRLTEMAAFSISKGDSLIYLDKEEFDTIQMKRIELLLNDASTEKH